MKEEEKETTLFESIEFIFHHPWLFIAPFIIIMSVVFAKMSTTPPLYQASASASFETIGGKIIRRPYRYNIDELIRRIPMVEVDPEVIKELWPDLSEEGDPQRYSDLVKLIRRVNMVYDPKVNLLRISFRFRDPELCYKAVQAAISSLKREIRRTTRKKLEIGREFLEKQMEYYKNRIRALDEDISRIKTE